MISDQQSAEWVPALLQISDPLFPTGAYAHSMGLEQWAATCEYVSGEDLEHFFKTHAGPSLARLVLPYLRFLRDAVVAGNWVAKPVSNPSSGALSCTPKETALGNSPVAALTKATELAEGLDCRTSGRSPAR